MEYIFLIIILLIFYLAFIKMLEFTFVIENIQWLSMREQGSCGMVQLLFAEVAEVYSFTCVPGGMPRLFWTMWSNLI